MSDTPGVIEYRAAPTIAKFHASAEPIRGIRGPIGSGKSVACVMELYMRAITQEPHNGMRKTRFAVIRQTYPELESTTIKTWQDWIPEFKPNGEPYCVINRQRPPTALLVDRLADGTTVHMEVNFLALDKEDDVKKLLSLELTGAWINEAKEVNRSVLDMLYGRCDRFPPKRQGGATWHGVIMDTNPPDDEHWWYKLAEEMRPTNHAFFAQPPSIIPLPKKNERDPIMYVPNMGQGGYPPAENVDNHNAGFEYWLRQTSGKDPEWIKVYLMGQYGSILAGKRVYSEYSDELHCSKEVLKVYNGLPLIIGCDFGLTPTAVICQLSPRGQLRVIDEIVTEDMGVRTFARSVLKPMLLNKYGSIPYQIFSDPAGTQRAQSNEVTCLQEMLAAGLNCQSARTNDFVSRREAVAGFLSRLTDGEPAFLLSPNCKELRKGFQGGYHYRKMKISGDERHSETPEKNKSSHSADSLQYACLEAESGGSNRGGSNSRHDGYDIDTVSAEGWT